MGALRKDSLAKRKPIPGERYLSLSAKGAEIRYYRVSTEYAEAFCRIADVARKALRNEYGLRLPTTVTFWITNRPNQPLRLWTDGRSRVFLAISNRHQLLRPECSGAFHVFGICHELAHLAMSSKLRTLDFSLEGGQYYEAWAVYAASAVLIPAVWEALGPAAWPDPYEYLSLEGPARLRKSLLSPCRPGRESYRDALKLFAKIDRKHGSASLGSLIRTLNVRQTSARNWVLKLGILLGCSGMHM